MAIPSGRFRRSFARNRILDAAVAHQGLQPFGLKRLAGGMRVEEPHLRDGSRTYEARLVLELRTTADSGTPRCSNRVI